MFREFCSTLTREMTIVARSVPTIEAAIIMLMAATVAFS
jgi:hypothetical protein